MTHEPFAAVIATEWKVSGMSSLVTNQFVSVAELFLAEVTSVPLAILMDSCMFG